MTQRPAMVMIKRIEKGSQSEMKGTGAQKVKGWQQLYSNTGRVLEGHRPAPSCAGRLIRNKRFKQKTGASSGGWKEELRERKDNKKYIQVNTHLGLNMFRTEFLVPFSPRPQHSWSLHYFSKQCQHPLCWPRKKSQESFTCPSFPSPPQSCRSADLVSSTFRAKSELDHVLICTTTFPIQAHSFTCLDLSQEDTIHSP